MIRSAPRGVIRPWYLVALLAVLAAGCSSAESGADDEGSTRSSSEATALAGPGIDAPAGDGGDQTLVEMEGQWALAREAMAAKLTTEIYRVRPDGLLIGPGGLSVDQTRCPDGWDERAGLDGDTITIAMTVAQTGQLAHFGDVATGMQAYMDQVNEAGGIDGTPIELVVVDDGYDPAVAVGLVEEMVEGDQPFYITSVGTPGAMAVAEALNDACIPQPFVVSPHPAWGDPGGRPFTSGFQRSHASEALQWGVWIERNLGEAGPLTVGALVIDNEFGDVYLDAFQQWADAKPEVVADVVVARHDPGADALDAEVAALAEGGVDVVIAMTAGQPCVLAMAETAAQGLAESVSARFVASGCTAPEQYAIPAGVGADEVLAMGAGMWSTNDATVADEPFVRYTNDTLRAAGLDPSQELIGVGFAQYGWAHVELLRVAASLPGGLTRSNVLLAMWGLSLDHPMLVDDVEFTTWGLDDSYPVEGAEVSRFSSAEGAWVREGPIVDVNGLTPPCAWDETSCS